MYAPDLDATHSNTSSKTDIYCLLSPPEETLNGRIQ